MAKRRRKKRDCINPCYSEPEGMAMRSLRVSLPIVLLVAVAVTPTVTPQSSPQFAITAANVSLVSNTSGGSSAYIVSNVPATGGLVVSCMYSGPNTTAKIPICGGGPVVSMPVTAGQKVTGTASIQPWGTPVPLSSKTSTIRPSPVFAFLLSVACLFGFGLPGEGRRWVIILVLAVGTTAIILPIDACGGGGNSFAMTAGTYTYTLTAGNTLPNTALSTGVSTTFTVTVP
jgi:hypothetical protein